MRADNNGHVAHSKIDPYGVVLAMDPVNNVVQQSADGGLLQRHSGRQATADQSGPHLPNTVPVPPTGQRDSAVCAQQAVERTLRTRNTHDQRAKNPNANIFLLV